MTYVLAFFTILGCLAVVFSFLVALLYVIEAFVPGPEVDDALDCWPATLDCWRSEQVKLPSGRRVELVDRRGCGR